MEVSMYFSLFWLYAVPQWNSIDRIGNIAPSVPLAIFSAGLDELIAPHQQKELSVASKSSNLLYLTNGKSSHQEIAETIEPFATRFEGWMNECLDRV
jgi:hypothetical protein